MQWISSPEAWVVLLAEGRDLHMSKTRIYFALAFSLGVEMLNLCLSGRGEPFSLKQGARDGRRGQHIVKCKRDRLV